MAAIFLARRSAAAAATNIPRAPATTRFSTAFQRDEGRNSASGSDEEGPAAFVADTVKKATEVADAMVDGAKNTVERGWGAAKDANKEVRETVVTGGRGEVGGGTEGEVEGSGGDEEGETVVEQVVEEIKDIDGPVDMAEYRAMAQNMEDLNNKVD
ncbi:hypothetical protein LINGRAHAP2_LOCUS31969 [Linum grandiflorum]